MRAEASLECPSVYVKPRDQKNVNARRILIPRTMGRLLATCEKV
jgi:hypothetical protein